MNTKYIILGLLAAVLLLPVSGWSQNKLYTITAKVMDEYGDPIPEASVSAGGGSLVVFTDQDGTFTLQAKHNDILLIKASGYSTQRMTVGEDLTASVFTLESLPFHLSEEDEINMPFGTFKKRRIVGGVTAINTDEILQYDNEQNFNGVLNSRVPGLFNGDNIRGLGAGLVIVDGIPRSANSLNLQEIDQITVLRGISARMLYGSQAERGVILVTTKRGEAHRRKMNVTAETGFLSAISYPEYLNAADYMELFNESLANDGQQARYSASQISNTRTGTDPVRFPDEDYFNSRYLDDMNPFSKVILEASGGNDNAQYYSNLGWNRVGSFLNLGEGANEKTDRFNLRGNVDYQLNDWLSMGLDGVALLSFSRSPNYTNGNFWNLASTLRPDVFPVLIPANELSETQLPSATLVDGNFVLGGTNEFGDANMYGELSRNGYQETNTRIVQINTGLNFDLGNILEGLTAKAYLSFDFLNGYILSQQNDYAVYQPVVGIDSTGAEVISYNKIGVDEKKDDQNINNNDIGFERRLGLYGVLDYDRAYDTGDRLKVTGVAYRDQFDMLNSIQSQKNVHFGLRGNYSIADKYIFEATGTYAGSQRFSGSNRWAFSPSLGAAWVVSEEDFLKDNNLVKYLKLSASWGILNTDQGVEDYYLYRTSFEQGGNFQYNDGVFQNNILNFNAGNENVGWVKRGEVNIGAEAQLGKALWVEANFFRSKLYDQLTRLTGTYPDVLGGDDFTPLENFESYVDQGIEAGINYGRKSGKFSYNIGANFVYSKPEALEVNESEGLPDYRKREGKETDAMFAYVADGFFADQADIDNHAVQTFGAVQPGDIKYKDLNGDGIINQDDQEQIGNSSARLQYGLNVQLAYGGLQLFIQGVGQTGGDRYFNNPYYWVYGDRKYSEEVLGRWTPETAATATYPRLSSTFNSNNFRNSTMWLYEDNWFNLRRVQLSYSLPFDIAGVKRAQIYLRAANLLTVSDIKDERELNIGSNPQTRTYAIGVNAAF